MRSVLPRQTALLSLSPLSVFAFCLLLLQQLDTIKPPQQLLRFPQRRTVTPAALQLLLSHTAAPQGCAKWSEGKSFWRNFTNHLQSSTLTFKIAWRLRPLRGVTSSSLLTLTYSQCKRLPKIINIFFFGRYQPTRFKTLIPLSEVPYLAWEANAQRLPLSCIRELISFLAFKKISPRQRKKLSTEDTCDIHRI